MNLNVTKSPVGNGIEKPVADNTKARMTTMNAPLDTSMGLNQTYDHGNLSAKFKNPNNKQDHVPADAFNQYQDQ